MGKRKRQHDSALVEKVRREIGLAASAEFVGYGIQRPDTEEFLFLADVRPDIEKWFWTPFPDFGEHFPTRAAAERVARLYDKPVLVIYMFDTGSQYIIAVDH